MNYKIYILLLMTFITPLNLFSLQRDQAIISEYLISPNINDFDCHSSSIIEVSSGHLCLVWKGGPGKGKSNIDMTQNVGIWCSHFRKAEWGVPIQIVEVPNEVCWNPVISHGLNGELTLFYRVGNDPRHTISLCKISNDGGLTWGKETLLPAGIVGPTRGKPIIDVDRNMICGSSAEAGAPEDDHKATACWIEILSDGQWSKYGPLEIPGKKFGCIEPVLCCVGDNVLKMFCRDRSHRIGLQGWIWTAESTDMGRTWSELKKTNLPNPDSAVEVVSLDRDNLILIYNHSHSNRYPLTVALSTDGGNEWTYVVNLEEVSGEFPSATVDSLGYIHVSYAWMPPGRDQRIIKHIVLDAKKLLN